MNYLFHILFLCSSMMISSSYSQVQQVIVIGVDGMGARGISQSPTPVMDSIMQNGCYTLKARAVLPTLSSPNWASMIMGTTPREHKIRTNKWERTDLKNEVFCQGKAGETYPSVFKAIIYNDSLHPVAVFHQWKEFDRLIEPELTLYRNYAPSEDTVIDRASQYITTCRPVFTFIHLDLVDHAGHHYGLKSQTYKSAIIKTDSLIGKFMSTLAASGMMEHTVIIITADHGFAGKRHGGRSRKEKEIPWMAIGAGIKKGQIEGSVNTYDTAPTIARLLSVRAPACWKGKVIKELFE